MISDQIKDTLVDQIVKGLIGQGTEGLKPVLELLLQCGDEGRTRTVSRSWRAREK